MPTARPARVPRAGWMGGVTIAPNQSWHQCHVGGNILRMSKSRLLTFEAFPQEIVLEGFTEEILSGLGMFLAKLSSDEVAATPYRVVARSGKWRSEVATKPRCCRPWHRHVQRDGEDLLEMPGGRVRLEPGRAEALVEWSEGSNGVDGFVATTLLEVAMGHALALNGYVVNHAAAIEIEGQALLVVGPSRSGKSTLGAAVLAAGGAVVSDDLVILGFDERGTASAGALRRNLWFRDGSEGLLPDIMRARLREEASFGEPRWGLERAAFPKNFRTRVRPRAIVVLRRDLRIRGYRLRLVSAADGLAGLILASSALFLSGRYPLERDRCMPALIDLANSARCFEVRMGKALLEDPTTIVRRLAADVFAD